MVACGFAVMQQLGFYAVTHESIFYVIWQEANKHIFSVIAREQAMTIIQHRMARSNNKIIYFNVVS
jgi:hypothetical protein